MSEQNWQEVPYTPQGPANIARDEAIEAMTVTRWVINENPDDVVLEVKGIGYLPIKWMGDKWEPYYDHKYPGFIFAFDDIKKAAVVFEKKPSVSFPKTDKATA